MSAHEDPRETIERLTGKVRDLEDQVKKLVAGELTLYTLQSELDAQLKNQEELLRLSQRLQKCHDEEEISELVAEALVENFEFEKAVICLTATSGHKFSVAGSCGYYDAGLAELACSYAPKFMTSIDPHCCEINTGNDITIHELGMDAWVSIPCTTGKGELLGCILCGTSREMMGYYRKIHSGDRGLWEVVGSITVNALENARLYRELEIERETLRSTRDTLRTLNEDLERTVLERTRELRESEAQYRRLYVDSERTGRMYRTLLDASPDPIVVYDIDGRPTYLNPAFTRVFGWTFEEVVGRRIDFVPTENWPETHDMIRKVLAGISFSNQETRRRTRDGRVIDVSISGAIYVDESGNTTGSIIHLRDITERKHMEEERLKLLKLESVGLLAGGIAHDFNNILSGVLMNAQLAKLKLPDIQEAIHYIDGIEEASGRAVALTQQLLTFSKGGAPILKPASIGDLIKDSAAFVLRGSNAKCEFHLPEDLSPVDIDAGQMSQVINNLIINADHSMPDGGIIRLVAENVTVGPRSGEMGAQLHRGRYVRISIHDQGSGIAKEDLHKIFDPYFTTKDGGSGLGLTSTLSIIRKHRGHITVDSESGKGTTVQVFLPVSTTGIIETRRASSADPQPGGRGRILVMDDEPILRDLITDALTSFGYEVEAAAEGKQALAAYSEAMADGRPFDVVLMDLTIPGGMGGKETVKRLREMDPSAKAIVSSGYSNDPIMADYTRSGFAGVVAKPYKIEELGSILSRIIDRRGH